MFCSFGIFEAEVDVDFAVALDTVVAVGGGTAVGTGVSGAVIDKGFFAGDAAGCGEQFHLLGRVVGNGCRAAEGVEVVF